MSGKGRGAWPRRRKGKRGGLQSDRGLDPQTCEHQPGCLNRERAARSSRRAQLFRSAFRRLSHQAVPQRSFSVGIFPVHQRWRPAGAIYCLVARLCCPPPPLLPLFPGVLRLAKHTRQHATPRLSRTMFQLVDRRLVTGECLMLQVKEAPPTPEKRVVARPGVPAPTRLSAFVVPDRPSPVQRPPDKDGHYVFELGENLSSRCAALSQPVLLCLLLCSAMHAAPFPRHSADVPPVPCRQNPQQNGRRCAADPL